MADRQANWILILLGLSLFLVAGCDDAPLIPEAPDVEQDPSEAIAEPRSADPVVQRANRHFNQIAAKVPQFGGMYLEEDATRLVVNMTDHGELNTKNVKNTIRGYLSREVPAIGRAASGGVEGLDISLREARYKYTDLQEWRDEITVPVLSMDEVALISTSHQKNRIRIGLEEPTVEEDVRREIEQLNVPIGAIAMEVTGPVRYAADGASSTETLEDKHRPLVGGLRIVGHHEEFDWPPPAGPCTYGFNAYWSGDRHFVTNSHWTGEMWGVDPEIDYYQSSFYDPDGFVGVEAHDPSGSAGCRWWQPWRECRSSDAALIELPSERSWDFGQIARTEHAGGSKIIDEDLPRFEIVQKHDRDNLFEGLPLSKMGQKTGWTEGTVRETCSDTTPSGTSKILQCQVFANYFADGGDSGSPVFHEMGAGVGTHVQLAGVHWGSVEGTPDVVFSHLEEIETDLGDLEVTIDDPSDPPDLTIPHVDHSVENDHPKLEWGAAADADAYEIERQLWHQSDWSAWAERPESPYVDVLFQNPDLEAVHPFEIGPNDEDWIKYQIRAVTDDGHTGRWEGPKYFAW